MAIIPSGIWPLDPTVTSGTELAQYLNDWVQAFSTQHANATRPPMIQRGGVWAKTLGATDIALMLYDGATDHEIGKIIGGKATFGGGTNAGTTAPASPAVGDMWFDTGASVLKIYDGANWNFVSNPISFAGGASVYGGTANAVTVSTGLNITSLTTGLEVRFRASSVNTGATTINVDGQGAAPAVTITGAALPSGYIRTDVDTVIRYNGVNWVADRAVEKGENANGAYVKWGDGTMICRKARLLSFNNSTNGTTTWTYPAGFVNASNLTVTTAANGNAGRFSNHYIVNTGPTPINVEFVQEKAADGFGYYAIAMGSWY